MNNPIEVSLRRHFEEVEDPQDNRGKEHNLLDIIVIAICAVISGGENFDTKHYLLMVILLFQQ
jgi:hypothetical protein